MFKFKKIENMSLLQILEQKDYFRVQENGDGIIAGVLTVSGIGTSEFKGNTHIAGNVRIGGTLMAPEGVEVKI